MKKTVIILAIGAILLLGKCGNSPQSYSEARIECKWCLGYGFYQTYIDGPVNTCSHCHGTGYIN
jgi:DnaJ-class molecular chaperone